ncbi:hypothetical protein IC582_004127 [Cucumis melo]
MRVLPPYTSRCANPCFLGLRRFCHVVFPLNVTCVVWLRRVSAELHLRWKTISLTSLLPSLTPKTPSSNKLPFLSRSSASQFHGAQSSHHILLSSLPSSSSSFKFTISSKVNEG